MLATSLVSNVFVIWDCVVSISGVAVVTSTVSEMDPTSNLMFSSPVSTPGVTPIPAREALRKPAFVISTR